MVGPATDRRSQVVPAAAPAKVDKKKEAKKVDSSSSSSSSSSSDSSSSDEKPKQPVAAAAAAAKKAESSSSDSSSSDSSSSSSSSEEPKKRKPEDNEQQNQTAEKKAKSSGENASVMVRNMPFSMTEEHLQELFSAHGEINRVKIPLGPDGRPRGFAFVDFTDGAAATASLALDQSEYDGRTLTVQMATPREPRQQQQDRNGGGGGGAGGSRQWQARNQNLAGQTPLLFFGGLSYNSTEDSIRQAVGGDEVVRVRIATDRETGKARGFGYVQFSSPEVAQRVFEQGGLNIDGRDVNIDYAEDRPSGGGGGGGGDRGGGGGFGGGRGGGGRGGGGRGFGGGGRGGGGFGGGRGGGGRGGGRGGGGRGNFGGQAKRTTFDD